MKKIILSLFIFISSLNIANSEEIITGVVDHSGGTDAAGCHTNRKTGVYHCH